MTPEDEARGQIRAIAAEDWTPSHRPVRYEHWTDELDLHDTPITLDVNGVPRTYWQKYMHTDPAGHRVYKLLPMECG